MKYDRPKCNNGRTFDYKTLKEYNEAVGGRMDPLQPEKIDEDRFVSKMTQIIDYITNP